MYRIINTKDGGEITLQANNVGHAMYLARRLQGWKNYGSERGGTFKHYTIVPLFEVKTQNVWEPRGVISKRSSEDIG